MTHQALSLAVPDLAPPLVLGLSTALVLAAVVVGWVIRRRAVRTSTAGSPAVRVAALAALGCTAYSADTSWRFGADYLDMGSTVERAFMFATAELALFATALMARQNLATQGAPGLPGALVWLITAVQIIPAYAEFGPVGGTVRALIGLVMAAVLWHLAMGIELRLRTPGAASRGLLASLGRELRERLLSRLGIAARDRDAAQITRDRATARAVTLAARLAERTPEQRGTWRGRYLTRRLSKAIGHAAVGSDPVQRTRLLDQLAVRRHAIDLASITLPSPWSHPQHQKEAGTVPAPTDTITTLVPASVPDHGPHHTDPSAGDRSPASRGPVPGTVPASSHSPGDRRPESGDRPREDGGQVALPESSDAGTAEREAAAHAAETRGPTDDESGTDTTGDRGPTDTDTGTDTTGDRGPADTDTGTDTTGDRGPADTDTGTDTTGDRGPADTDTGTDTTSNPGPDDDQSGTDTTGDRGHTVPLRRKPTGVKGKGKRNRARRPQAQRPSRELLESADQLARQVLPHVPAVLERDGNEALSRVQLREILRQEGLTGGRNERLSLVLQQLRSEATTTTTTTRSSR
ncbi:hypothetical protein V1460_30240 [Streptomyces sp. SCSIO 30461]|uniref:hypothetical protein n=1 Tax=Streptomyces sp. SCSIO 30461 TaxID=3118085 RepID=UPI0030D29EB0